MSEVAAGVTAVPPDAGPVAVELVHSEPAAREAVGVLAAVWGRNNGEKPMTPELAWVFAHSGNYVSVARADGLVVGSAIGFRGQDEAGPLLHSHIAGVLPGHQGASVGFALKQHQRRWALDAGLDRITWTFDPLVARNAYFNVMKLGARCTGYYVDFYGPMDDAINGGDETDRVLVTWKLSSPSTLAAAAGAVAPVDLAALADAGALTVLQCRDDRPVAAPAATSAAARADGRILLAELPADAVEVRRRDPAAGRAWRRALRDVMVAAFADGYQVVGATRSSCYVLAPATA